MFWRHICFVPPQSHACAVTYREREAEVDQLIRILYISRPLRADSRHSPSLGQIPGSSTLLTHANMII